MDIIRFLNATEEIKSHLHSFILLKDGAVIAEGYHYPYEPEQVRLLHSGSKTFTAVAVGIATGEKRLTLEDKVIDFFPEYKDVEMDAKFPLMTVKHLLEMATGHSGDSLFTIADKENWIEAFIKAPLKNEPGTEFLYDSGATFMLSAIISKATGMSLEEYLKPRLFEPLEITDYEWDSKDGVTTGGWGLMIKPEDFAKLGMLFLNKGEFNGKRILDESWIELASSEQVATSNIEIREDWAQGYGFQMWRGSENTYRADGAFGQFCVIAPDKNLVAVMTCEDADSQELLSAFYGNIVSKAKDSNLFANSDLQDELSRMLSNKSKPFVYDATTSYMERRVNEKVYTIRLTGKDMPITFDFRGSDLKISIGETQVIESSKVSFKKGVMDCEIAPVTFIKFFDRSNRRWKYAASHEWQNDETLVIHVYYTETAHRQQLELKFSEDAVEMRIISGLKKLLEANGALSSIPIAYKDILIYGTSS
ncbi:serine hydrolase [uncultured Planococcus sp.]|uniref:serine hydrolase domain-containing protein n=1 Tax=uncultured Planococcus sp. TaxID=337815 RepID=UPI0026352E14|nr:serine hydrolase [uncultured Planococcus sp.]